MAAALGVLLERETNAPDHGNPGSDGLAEIGASRAGSGDVAEPSQAAPHLGETPGSDRQTGICVGSERLSSEDTDCKVGSEVEVYTFNEFISLRLERPRHAVQDLLAEGQNALLIGRFAIGKTLLALQLSAALAAGRDFLGRNVARPYKVAFIDCENGQEEIQSRLKTQTEALSLSTAERGSLDKNWLYVDGRCGLTFRLGGLGPLTKLLSEHSPEVLLVDNLGRVFSGDIEKQEDVRKFFSVLDSLRREHSSMERGLTIFLHHLTKVGNQDGPPAIPSLLTAPYEFLCRSRGSGRLLDFSETRLAIAEEMIAGEEPFYVVNGLMRSGNVAPLLLQRNSETLSFELHTDKNMVVKHAFATSLRRRELFDLLPNRFRFKDALAIRDSNNKLFSRDTVAETLRVAQANDIIRHEKNGEYTKLV